MNANSGKLKVAICELTSVNDQDENLKNVLNFLESIPKNQNIDVITLPENTFFMRLAEGEKVTYLSLNHPYLEKYKAYAKERKVLLHIGATPVEINEQHYNATLLIYPDGKLEVPYKKVHLFDIQLDNQKAIRESDIFKHGSNPSVVSYKGWKFGMSICYDIRFSELFLYYQQLEVDVIFIPSAFLVETGKAHWEILNRARAIEAQSYVVSAAQGGQHSATRSTYGHSIAVDPWGRVLSMSEQETRPHYHLVELDKEKIASVRKQIPMKNHRKLTVHFNK